ncbi:MAG: MerR family transcriptional regulator [Clostridiales bacterium]|nr:MerR family transcriptional regulator [Clostridiales bacterium]MDY3746110.1 MerR family transcriptional regulator [Lachnospiraceae bacterium]
MSKYLSIGQVAQIKGVHVKSLRYYDKIGILKPAYTDPNTGYRYYERQQLLYIDLIQFLVDLDIPLKNWFLYCNEDGTFNLKKLLADGR